MNKRISNFILFTLLVVCAIFVLVLTSSEQGRNGDRYTVSSTREDGLSLFYDTLDYMGYNVSISYEFVKTDTSIDNIQVLTNPVYFNEEIVDDLADWIERGGILVLNYRSGNFAYELFKRIDIPILWGVDDVYEYKFGMGRVLLVEKIDILRNSNIMENAESKFVAMEIIDFIDSYSHDKIIFNKSYQGFYVERNFFNLLPMGFRIGVYHIAVVLVVLVIFLGKRFGKAIPYYEEIERDENEYIHALSSLYMNLGMGNVATDIFLERFIKKATDFFKLDVPDLKIIYENWKINELSHKEKLEYIITEKDNKINTKKRSGKLELKKMYYYINELINVLDKKD